ncbi:MAG: hypothetical protein RLZ75_3291 [Pseudomonadota bacterium]
MLSEPHLDNGQAGNRYFAQLGLFIYIAPTMFYDKASIRLLYRNYKLASATQIAATMRFFMSKTQTRIAIESYPGVTPKNNRHKKSPRFYSKALIYLAPPDGLEPPT